MSARPSRRCGPSSAHEDWVHLPGRVPDEELVSWYRKAWVVVSTSQREGWGMTLTEAAACGTPVVATDIAGHRDAVVDGESGLLVDDLGQLPVALGRVLGDDVLRNRLTKGALAQSRWFTWDVTARSGARSAGRGRDELRRRRPLRTRAGVAVRQCPRRLRRTNAFSGRGATPSSPVFGRVGT